MDAKEEITKSKQAHEPKGKKQMKDLYISKGWYIFPLNGKIPTCPNGFKAAVNTEKEYDELVFKYPGNNIGICTGKDFFVLDVDIKNESKGLESLKTLTDKYGPLPQTVEATTWSGGKHYLFKMPKEGMGNRTNVLEGIDIRGRGGYIVAPPSTIEGKPYSWVNDPFTTPIAEAPEWLLAILKERAAPVQHSEGEVIQGQRNSELASRAGKMRNAGMDSHDIYAALLKINATKCVPPLSDKEVRCIAESIGHYEVRNTNAALTDMWNAERFVEQYGRDIRWCDKLGGWFMWDGVAWRQSDDTAMMRLAKMFVKNLTIQAESSGDKRLKAHAIKTENSGKLMAILELAKSEQGVATDFKLFDQNNNLLNCENGTLDLDTLEIRPAKRSDLLTKSLSLAYDPNAKAPLWEKFLNETFQGDVELIEYVQRAAGYCLSGSTAEQKFFLCVGNGKNGKSTFLKTLTYILAPSYSSSTPSATMLENDGNTLNAIAAIKGMRLVVLNEFDEGKTLSCAQVKNLTGGEPVVARLLYHEQFTYTPTYKFWLTTNFKPRIKDTSLGIWRRLVVLPFDYTVPKDKMDKTLDDKLKKEFPGILAWAVDGYKKWQANGLPELQRLTDVASMYQSDSDLIGQFIADVMDKDVEPEKAETSVVDFIQALKKWADENGIKYYPQRSTIIDYMDKKGYGRPYRINSVDMRGRLAWKGIAIRVHSHYSPSAIY